MPNNIPATPFMREFLYTVLYLLPDDQKFNLKGRFYSLSRSQKAAKAFCDKATEDDVKYILSLLGFRWFTVIYDPVSKPTWVRNVFEYFKPEDDASSLRKLIEKRLYITGDKDYVFNLGLANQNINQKNYVRFLELAKAGFHKKRWNRFLNGLKTNEAIDDMDSLEYFSKMSVSSFIALKSYNLSENELMILLYLVGFRNNYVEVSQISKHFEGVFSKTKVIRNVRVLLQADLLTKYPGVYSKKYTISALGIHHAIKYFQEMITSNSM